MSTAVIAMVLAGIGTYAMRASFLVVAHRMGDIGPRPRRWLRQIPPAALAAIVVPGVLHPEGHIDVWQIRTVAALVTTVVALRTTSVVWPLLAGTAVLTAAWVF
jgi:branched-subunit amino acid transport protein